MSIYHYCQYGNLPELQRLISEGFDVNKKDNDGWISLHYACFNGHLNIVKELIKQGANINSLTNEGNTPLHFASNTPYTHNLEIINELIDYSNLSIKNNDGKTVLDFAKTEKIKQFIIDYQELPTIKEPDENKF